MAWRSSATTNADLITNLQRHALLTSPRAISAFRSVDRAHFLPATTPPQTSYADSPQPIGHAATISAPHMHASAVEALLPFLPERPRRPLRVLDVGSGSGYLTAVLGQLVGEQGRVVGVEHVRELVELAEGNLRRWPGGRSLLDSGRVRFVVGDGRRGYKDGDVGGVAGMDGGDKEVDKEGDGDGDGDEMGWDAIHVGAGAAMVHPELVEQLRRPGRMFIPVDDSPGGFGQHIWIIDKDAQGNVTKKREYGVNYVPLTDAPY